MARRKPKTDPRFKTKRYTQKTVMRDREYGFYWYAWLWHIVRPFMVFLCALLIVVGMVSTGWNMVYDGYIAPPEPNNPATYGFTISSGESISTIGKNLLSQNFIRSTKLFQYYIKLYGLTNAIQSGVYYIAKDMTLFEVVDAISSGNATNERTIRVIPGWTCEDIADYLVSVGAIANRDVFLTECKNYRSYIGYSLAMMNADAANALSGRTYPLEGYLAPDTYRVYLSADSGSIIRTLLKQTDVVMTRVFEAEDTGDETDKTFTSALTTDEMYILASIIEKEAGSYEDMRKVSAVFHNRLNQNMKLQSDPTATYLTGNDSLALTSAQTSVQTAYNTYVIAGLPIGPICNPSENALKAALHPDEEYVNGGYLFFCAGVPGTGSLVYAKTNAEHEQNVAYYRPMWEQYDKENAAKAAQ